jgi:hypothetical protein
MLGVMAEGGEVGGIGRSGVLDLTTPGYALHLR